MLKTERTAEPLGVPRHRSMCTDCGISRSSNPNRCAKACQFIKPDYPKLETFVHGRTRDDLDNPDELFFGPHLAMYQASLAKPKEGAQWTGLTTEIGYQLLKSGHVDAVIAVKADPEDRWKPVPALITNADDMAQCRGMRMGYAPSLALLETAVERGYKRLAFIGIPCQVYALRSLQSELGLEKLYVIGTPCSDNTTTENFHSFLSLLSDQPETISYLEFRPDYHVELRFDDGSKKEIPFLKLPISDLPEGFFPLTCQTCVDYTNALADITVGYMGGQGEQWVIVRNETGEELLSVLGDSVNLSKPQSSGNRVKHVNGFKKNLENSQNGIPVRRMPEFIKPLVSWLMPRIGPKGLEFARARVEMKAIESILHLKRNKPKSIKNMVPSHVWKIAQSYGLRREEN
ncbi:MAG: Coenzyme F420 hydrogenase/dehydrogenase, beta subunit C-terminal domain [Pseudomonadota bacterium]